MKFPHGAVLSLLFLFIPSAHAQTAPVIHLPSSPQFVASAAAKTSSSTESNETQPSEPQSLATSTRSGAIPTRAPGRIGVDVHAGINGIGADVALAVASHFNVRLGGQFFGYSSSFQEEGANVNATLRLGGGRASLDWFPFHNGFHVSPLLVFLNQTSVRAKVIVPSGETISLDDGDYVSSQADPLHGSASIGVWKTSPGLMIGYGNIIPRSGKHFSFPVEAGFYYVGQPTLKVDFSGSACDPTEPQPLGCQPVQQDAGFQHDLAAFIRRNNNNLSYASFLPVVSFGVGYSF
ncbi:MULTISPECIES: hypothetical protein [Acidobacteriaceae]|uniref:hypothetical protein n=1 Tax=Acidobacteriaceae TaxID=204434 RepID=UPI00131C5449|nr:MULTISPECIES: hypothetical protein [Acidobacteriaceae]MDW5264273.1 hypothetical protein [Edaphobacter sp.]